MSIISLFSSITSFFRSGKAEKVFESVAQMVPAAMPIVESLQTLVPTRTANEIAYAYKAYAVPLTAQVEATAPEHRGYLLLDLASKVLANKYPNTTTSVLNAAVQVAVVAMKAK